MGRVLKAVQAAYISAAGSQPAGSQPASSQPAGSQPGSSQPDGSQPDGSQPGGSQPGGSPPEGWEPDDESRLQWSEYHGAWLVLYRETPGGPVKKTMKGLSVAKQGSKAAALVKAREVWNRIDNSGEPRYLLLL